MTVLELIAKLDDLTKTHGDLEVWADNGEDFFFLTPVDEVKVGTVYPSLDPYVLLQNSKAKKQGR